MSIKINIPKELFIKTCNESISMAQACSKLNIHFNSFKRIALEYGCYKPNQSGKGSTKISCAGYNINDILDGKYPQYSIYKLKTKLLKKKILTNVCSICGISDWNNMPLNMELHHIDGNRCNHTLSNLIMLCPNCHAQTDTYRAKKKRK